MNRAVARSPVEAELLVLTTELLDAHTDTVEIGAELPGGLRWQAHLDYLRALQRRTSELLARAETEPAAPGSR